MNYNWKNNFESFKRHLCELDENGSAKIFAADFFDRFVVIWTLISRIPLPEKWWPKRKVPGEKSLAAIPLAGALMGLLTALFILLLRALGAGNLPSAWLGVAFYAISGWTMHLDGWGDLWDGIGSGKSGDEMRRIMKDSRLGASGAVGLILALGAWTSLAGAIPTEKIVAACVLSAAIGRLACCSAALFGLNPWNDGMSKGTVDTFGANDLLFALACTVPLLALAPKSYFFSAIIAISIGYGIAQSMNSRLGGVNGDVLGAAAVSAEILVLAVFTIC